MVWVSKWVDYSDKYGFGYQLSDDTIGVIFNDLTKLLLLVNGKYVLYKQSALLLFIYSVKVWNDQFSPIKN